jgi:hypothetical protein
MTIHHHLLLLQVMMMMMIAETLTSLLTVVLAYLGIQMILVKVETLIMAAVLLHQEDETVGGHQEIMELFAVAGGEITAHVLLMITIIAMSLCLI